MANPMSPFFQNWMTMDRQSYEKALANNLAMNRQDPFADPYSQMGGGGMGMGGFLGMMDPASEYGRAQLRMNNLQNPNQLQGSAQNAGMGLGAALAKIGGGQQPTGDSGEQEGSTSGGPDPMMTQFQINMRSGLSPRQSLINAAKDYAAQSKGDPVALRRANLALIRAKDMPDDYQPGALSPEQAVKRGLPQPQKGYMWVQDKAGIPKQEPMTQYEHFSANIDEQGHTEERYVNKADPTDTGAIPGTRGIKAQQTAELGNNYQDKILEKAADAISSANGVHDAVSSLLVNIEKNGIGGGLPSFIAEHASNFKGILDFARQKAAVVGDIDSLSTNHYLENLAKMGEMDAKTQSVMVALAYQMAGLQVKQEGSGKVGIQEVRQMLEQLGGHLSNIDAIRQALMGVRESTNRSVMNVAGGAINYIPDNLPKKQIYNGLLNEYKARHMNPDVDGQYEVGKVYDTDEGKMRYTGGGYRSRNNWEKAE